MILHQLSSFPCPFHVCLGTLREALIRILVLNLCALQFRPRKDPNWTDVEGVSVARA